MKNAAEDKYLQQTGEKTLATSEDGTFTMPERTEQRQRKHLRDIKGGHSMLRMAANTVFNKNFYSLAHMREVELNGRMRRAAMYFQQW